MQIHIEDSTQTTTGLLNKNLWIKIIWVTGYLVFEKFGQKVGHILVT